MRRATSSTIVRASGSPLRAAVKIARGSYGGVSEVAVEPEGAMRAASAATPSAQGSTPAAGGSPPPRHSGQCPADLAGRAVIAAMKLPAEYQPHAHAGADG